MIMLDEDGESGGASDTGIGIDVSNENKIDDKGKGKNRATEAHQMKTKIKYYVEYWTRQEWHHILAHQDMDEGWERLLR